MNFGIEGQDVTIPYRSRRLATLSVATAWLLLAPIAGAQEYNSRDVETYQIWDIRSQAPKRDVIRATQDGFNTIVNKSDTILPIVMDAPPATPSRFRIVDNGANPALAASPLMAFIPAAMRSQLRDASCGGAVWIASSRRPTSDNYARPHPRAA